MHKTLFTFLFLLPVLTALSQTNELPVFSADRPGVSTSPFLAPPKIAQVETGFAYEKITGDLFQENTLYNTTLLRYGINKNTEIRVQDDYAQLKTDIEKNTGFNPLIIGTKLLISEQKKIIPQTSLLVNVTLPFVGKKIFRPTNPAPSFYLLMQNDLTKNLNVCYNAGLEYDGESGVPQEFAAVCFGDNLTEQFSVFIENYDWFSDQSSPQNYFDLGGAYLIKNKFQIDLSANMNLRDVKNYYMFNVGFSWRLMKS